MCFQGTQQIYFRRYCRQCNADKDGDYLSCSQQNINTPVRSGAGTFWGASPLSLFPIFRLSFKNYFYFSTIRKLRIVELSANMDLGSRWDSAQNRIPNEINSRVRGQSASRFRDTRWLVNNFSITYTKSSLLSRIYKKHCIVVIKMACAWECLNYAIWYNIPKF